MKKKLILIFLVILFAIDAMGENKDTLKGFYTGEIVVLPKDNQLERCTKIEEYAINSLANQRFQTVDNALNSLPGLRIQKNSKNESYLRMRGYDQRQIGIFFDGVPIINQFDGMVDVSNFSTNSVSKINVSKGLPSNMYGANNLGGSINIITDNVFSNNYGIAKIQLGNQIQSYSAKIAQNLDKFFVTTSYSAQKSNNFNSSSSFGQENKKINNSSFENKSAFVKVAFMNNENSLLSLSFLGINDSKDIPINIETMKPKFWKMPEINMYILNLTHGSKFTDYLSLRGNFFLNKGDNILYSYDDATYSTQTTKSSFISKQKDSKFGGILISEINTGLVDLTKLSISISQDKHDEQSNTGAEWKSFESRLSTIAIEQNLSYKSFGAIIGTNYDVLIPVYAHGNTLRDEETSMNYHFGINYNADDFRIFANYSHKSRFPTLKEFYAEMLGANIANPYLFSETGQNSELGVNYKIKNNLIFTSSLYYNNIKNLIDIAFLPENKRQFINIGKAQFYGLETSINYQFNQYNAFISLNYLKSENVSDNAATSILTLRPEMTLLTNISAKYQFGLDFEVEYLLYKKQYAYNSDKKIYYEMPDYGLLNFAMQYRIFENISIIASLQNIFDTYYISDWGYPQQGFNFSLGVRLAY